MRKVAIFVEGMTEQVFVAKLVAELVGARGAHVEFAEQFKGLLKVTGTLFATGANIHVLIVDCQGDNQVKTQIVYQYSSLVAANYSAIIGLRDFYPEARANLGQVQAKLQVGLPVGAIVPAMHLAVMEVEAWFIAEVEHFSNISAQLTVPFIVSEGYDLASRTPDSWDHPAETLHAIYQLAQRAYLKNGKKSRKRVERTVRALSFEGMYENLRQTMPDLNGFIHSVETALL